jgi:prepilin-type processing-associated H-X9-DG protein
MKPITILFVFTAMSCMAGLCQAAGDNDPAAQIAPFVNEQTIAVVHLDAADVDMDAMELWANAALSQSKLDESDRKETSRLFHGMHDKLALWISDFKKAGGKSIWFVFTLEDFPSNPPVFMVIPIEKGADPAALKKLWGVVGPGPHSYGLKSEAILQVHDALVIGPTGAGPYAKIQAQPRPELSKALAAAGTGKLQVALIPSEGARRVIESMAPSLPGGAPATALSQGVLWGGAGVQLPPEVSVHLVVQSQDAASAKGLLALIQSLSTIVQKQTGDDFGKTSLLRAAAALGNRAQVHGDQLLIDLDKSQATALAVQLSDSLHGAREQANRVKSASNIKQLLLGTIMWANNKTKQGAPFPDNLDQVLKDQDVSPQVLINPRHPELPVGYVYIKAPEGEKAPGDRLVIYEKFTQFGPGINVGFADGHVEWIADERLFNKLRDEAERISKAGVPPKAATPNSK